MALTLVFSDDFNADHSGSYDFASFSHPAPFILDSGHLNLQTGGLEWAVAPKGISIPGSGVQVVKFHCDAAARATPDFEITNYWGDAGPDIDPYGGSSFLIASSTDEPLTLRTYNGGDNTHVDTTVTVPNGAFTGWLVSKRVPGTITSEVWDTDPGGGGSALATLSNSEGAGDVAQRVSVEWFSPLGGYVDYWNVYTGTGTIPVQDVVGATPVPTRSLLGVGT